MILLITFLTVYFSRNSKSTEKNLKGSVNYETHRNENDKKISTETGKNLSRHKNEKGWQIVSKNKETGEGRIIMKKSGMKTIRKSVLKQERIYVYMSGRSAAK